MNGTREIWIKDKKEMEKERLNYRKTSKKNGIL